MTTLQPIGIPLTKANRQLAFVLGQTQKNAEKAKQLQLNILSVCAAEQYFSYLGIETNREESDGFDVIQQSMIDSADLMLSNLGKIECRPVLADQNFMTVPPETWSDRIGYVAVQLNESLTEGRVLGFVRSVKQSRVSIKQLQDIDCLLDYLEKLEPLIFNLRNRVVQLAHSGWELVSEAIDTVLVETAPEVNWAFRSRSTTVANQGVTCQKYLNQIPFRVSLYPQTELDYDYDVIVSLRLEKFIVNARNMASVGQSNSGENALYVAILDEDRTLLREENLIFDNSKEYTALTFDLQGNQGDSFIIKVDYQEKSVEETMNL